MSIMLRIVDKNLGAEPVPAPDLLVPFQTITARQILRLRVEAEIASHKAARGFMRMLIPPSAIEAQLNLPRAEKSRPLDPQKQVARAIEAFEKRRIIMLVDNRQIEALDEPFLLSSASEARFIKLTPLVGG